MSCAREYKNKEDFFFFFAREPFVPIEYSFCCNRKAMDLWDPECYINNE